MGSTRLPGKVLADIAGRPMLWHVVTRVGRVAAVDRVAVATSDQPEDDPVRACCDEHGFACFRGDGTDVLDRFHLGDRGLSVLREAGEADLADAESFLSALAS